MLDIKMRIIIFGYYFKKNLGDDAFEYGFRHIIRNHELTFVYIDKILETNVEDSDAIIVGGGDLLNDQYGPLIQKKLEKYTGYKIAIGVGISFEDCLTRKYIHAFDDIIIRNRRDLPMISRELGTVHTHYLPDLVYSLPLNTKKHNQNGRNIGFFLVGGEMLNNKRLFLCILKTIDWLIREGYVIHLISMYTNMHNNSNDLNLNKTIYEFFVHVPNQVKFYEELNYQQFLDIFHKIDIAFCVKLHSHIFCSRFGVPFVSVPYTRKVELFVSELPIDTQYLVDVARNQDGNVIDMSIKSIKCMFKNVFHNRTEISFSLLRHSTDSHNIYNQHNKIVQLLESRITRTSCGLDLKISETDFIYQKYNKKLLALDIDHTKDSLTDKLSDEQIDDFANLLCFEITGDTSNYYYYGMSQNLKTMPEKLKNMIEYVRKDYIKSYSCPRINLNFIKQDTLQGLHRAGWSYAMAPLYAYSGSNGVIFDFYLDRTFVRASKLLESNNILPYSNNWVGFIHHTFNTEFSRNNCVEMFENPLFLSSLYLCRGIYTLSEYLAVQLREALAKVGYPNIIVEVVRHPTLFVQERFDFDKFMSNRDRKLINVGCWYRNPITIYRVAMNVKQSLVKCYTLKGKLMENNFCPSSLQLSLNVNGTPELVEKGNNWAKYYFKYVSGNSDNYSKDMNSRIHRLLKDKNTIDLRKCNGVDILSNILPHVGIISTLSDRQYDTLFTENIIFLDLVDASAVNTLLEIVVRKTPVLVNKHPAVVEVLGEDYPLYYNSVESIEELLTPEKIKEAHMYLQTLDDEIYRLEYFTQSILNSKIYSSLP